MKSEFKYLHDVEKKNYCIVGKKNGHKVWYCGYYAPRKWSRGDGYAIAKRTLQEIKKYYKIAARDNKVKNIHIVLYTERLKIYKKEEVVHL